MDYKTKSELIANLADSFYIEENSGVTVSTSHYIPETVSVDTTLNKVKIGDLKKTKGVIDEHIVKFSNKNDMESAQVISHLRLASLCVGEIISQKMNEEKHKKDFLKR